ncbi:MAG TPA: hypothetical protein VFI30_02590 [Nocardioidaceae bacterium]|nr:hypothetical protein [Nocardioidaceae bacterium]
MPPSPAAPGEDRPVAPGSRPAGPTTAEHRRLAESAGAAAPWRLWGPYLAGRQWGTVREDYSADGDAWSYLSFEQSHARAYRWGEDGIAGLCDRFGFLNFGVAMWNGHDDRLKERYFGLTNAQGNHGEDAKEYWWPLDATPTHSWASHLYRYPQAAFPYDELVAASAARGRDVTEFELADTGIFDGDRFFDVETIYAKRAPDDICIRVTATNRGPEAAPLHLVPQLWFRNTWSWGRDDRHPLITVRPATESANAPAAVLQAVHSYLGRYVLAASVAATGEPPEVLVCDNETNSIALFGTAANPSPYPKDAVGRTVVHGVAGACNPAGIGTKAALWYRFEAVPSGQSVSVELRLRAGGLPDDPFGADFAATFERRRADADEFYASVIPAAASDDDRLVARRAFAGLLWGKQVYRYDVREWLDGDPAQPAPPAQRCAAEPTGRNTAWTHLSLADVISMPDEWEYPWFACWDLAFHCVTLAHVDPDFAKEQLVLMCREWAMNPDGQLPAYEWNFSDVNPPVHAWAAWQVYVADGCRDTDFLIRVFTKLIGNFAWWVNRKDPDGSDLFEGGFLGMDNIGFFDRSAPLANGLRLEQSDATSWMAFYCLGMLRIALELARRDPAWDGLATKFLEHFLSIAEAMRTFGSQQVSLWDEQDGFFYDVLVAPDGSYEPLRVRSAVGLLPLLAVAVSPEWVAREVPDFTARLAWLRSHRPDLTDALVTSRGADGTHHTLALVTGEQLTRVLARLVDQAEFLSPYGIRSLSAAYREPLTAGVDGRQMSIQYNPGESDTGLFGGNSNWRGPVWFPINVLLVDAIETYCEGAGADVRVEFPAGSGEVVALHKVAVALRERLVALFRPGADGRRPGDPRDHGAGPLWTAHPTFSEYFHGDTGAGLGASHQTGWTALVAHLICARPA